MLLAGFGPQQQAKKTQQSLRFFIQASASGIVPAQ
jgi:hypothetical protein